MIFGVVKERGRNAGGRIQEQSWGTAFSRHLSLFVSIGSREVEMRDRRPDCPHEKRSTRPVAKGIAFMEFPQDLPRCIAECKFWISTDPSILRQAPGKI
jgi:hypothetical protein